MGASLNDFLDFVLFWIKKRTEVHLGELVVYPAMVRHCLCCQGNGNYAHETNGLCPRCCVPLDCTMCGESFTPSDDSVGVFCPACWAQLETSWKTTFEQEDPVRAETSLRSTVSAARPILTGCRH
ncbi:MAG: hypothetical protein AAF682_14005 [Planctomycetota bacterium]